ncbi:MAG: hypothetical protein FK734_11595 [Asgard group archaeon]|nr:hypothetical protein [Asgard group archaeon]
MIHSFKLPLNSIQPSQLYISKKKLQKVNLDLEEKGLTNIDSIPVKKLNDEIIFVDGHTRALALFFAGFNEIDVYWEDEDLDWEMYTVCVEWCKNEKIFSIKDLASRVIDHEKYEILWYKRCEEMQEEIIKKRQI